MPSARSRAVSPALAAPRWDRTRLLFEIEDDGAIVACAISREAVQDVTGQRYGKPPDLLRAFESVRPLVEAVAREKHRTRPASVDGVVTVWSDDVEDYQEAQADAADIAAAPTPPPTSLPQGEGES